MAPQWHSHNIVWAQEGGEVEGGRGVPELGGVVKHVYDIL